MGKRIGRLVVIGFAAASAIGLGTAAAEGDPDKGKTVFKTCAACHSLEAGKAKVGPSLHGLLGRKAGTVGGFRYSDAMKSADIVWNAETLDGYLAAPKEFIPGNRMPFPGLKDPADRADVIAYLQSLDDGS